LNTDASLNHCKKMKAEPSRLIPLKQGWGACSPHAAPVNIKYGLHQNFHYPS